MLYSTSHVNGDPCTIIIWIERRVSTWTRVQSNLIPHARCEFEHGYNQTFPQNDNCEPDTCNDTRAPWKRVQLYYIPPVKIWHVYKQYFTLWQNVKIWHVQYQSGTIKIVHYAKRQYEHVYNQNFVQKGKWQHELGQCHSCHNMTCA